MSVQKPSAKPNILFIMCDQMRGDCMGIAGHPDVKTPYLDTLASEGTYFSNAYSACPSCIPARAALFTGMTQEHHKRVGYEDGIAWEYPHMLPAELAKNGYHTEAVGKLHVHPPLRRCGFQNLTLHDGYIGFYRRPVTPYSEHQLVSDSYIRWLKNTHDADADVNNTGLECNSWIARPWIYDEMSHPTNWVVSESIEFLRKRDRNEPFFLMTSFVRPHPPLDAPAAYFDMYRDMKLSPPAMGDWVDRELCRKNGRIYDSPFGCCDETLRREAMIGYYACITHMDHQIGRLLQALYREQLLEDTIIIFTSDHGELLFDHDLFRKVLPYQGSVHIPLIIRVGKHITQGVKQAAVSDALVELRDLMPTMLDASGSDIPPTVDGRSLWKTICSEQSFGREYLHGEHSFNQLSNHYIVTAQDKYIWFSQSGREQYFDLSADPSEETNLIGSTAQQERIAALRNILITELKGREEGYTDGVRLIAGKTPVNILK